MNMLTIFDVTSIELIIDEIDWTSAWSKKYPILASYQGIKGINIYCEKIFLNDQSKDNNISRMAITDRI